MGWFNRWTIKRGVERLQLMRAGSEAVTPMIELARMVGPTGIMWGSREEVDTRFFGWTDEWERLRRELLTYTNAHPSEKVKEQGQGVAEAVGTSLSATRYLFLTQTTHGDDVMESFHNAEARQAEAIESAERLLKTIRSY